MTLAATQFQYQARDDRGLMRNGEVVAADSGEAARKLRQEGLYVVALTESASAISAPAVRLFQRRVSRAEIIYFTNQLAVMVDAGVPVAEALSGLARQTDNPTLRNILQQVQNNVEGGEDLSAALARFPKHFNKTYVNLVKASEASGTLGPMLERVAVQARAELETRQKVRGAMTYPAVMLVMCLGVSVFLLTFVFPKLTPMFATRNIEIPAPTRIMMALSEAMTHRWYLFALGLALLVGFACYARRQQWGRLAWDWTTIRLPILGSMLRKVSVSRSLRTLATTVNAGIPMLEALELSAGVAGNLFYEQSWREAGRQVADGKQIHEALEGNPLFPQTLLQMIASGESTGKLGEVLGKVSDYFDREVAQSVKTTTSMVEPIMVTVMGGVIGAIALAMLLPIFKLSGSAG